MSNPLPREDKQLLQAEQGYRFYRRLAAAFALHTGRLSHYAALAREKGELPYRILRYQHVVQPDSYPLPLSTTTYVKPETFEMHLRYLIRETTLIPLDELVGKIEREEKIEPRTVALTFDGGYLDFYQVAFPLIRTYNVPVTVFLPTHYIGTQEMFWQDMVLFGMLILEQHGQPFPEFSFLDQRFKDNLSLLSPNKQITLPVIALFIDFLSSQSFDTRMVTLTVLTEILIALKSFPDVRLFVNWNEIEDMQRTGVRFGSLGHQHIPFNEFSSNQLEADLRNSYQTLREHNVDFLRVICYPEGAVTKEARKLLYETGARHSLGIGRYPAPSLKGNQLTVLGRIPMFQDAAYCKEVFACRLYSVNVFGYQF